MYVPERVILIIYRNLASLRSNVIIPAYFLVYLVYLDLLRSNKCSFPKLSVWNGFY